MASNISSAFKSVIANIFSGVEANSEHSENAIEEPFVVTNDEKVNSTDNAGENNTNANSLESLVPTLQHPVESTSNIDEDGRNGDDSIEKNANDESKLTPASASLHVIAQEQGVERLDDGSKQDKGGESPIVEEDIKHTPLQQATESETILLPSSTNLSPLGPANSMAFIVSAAFAAAKEAIADTTQSLMQGLSVSPPAQIDPADAKPSSGTKSSSPHSSPIPRRPRAKLVAAKSVLFNNPDERRKIVELRREREQFRAYEEQEEKKKLKTLEKARKKEKSEVSTEKKRGRPKKTSNSTEKKRGRPKTTSNSPEKKKTKVAKTTPLKSPSFGKGTPGRNIDSGTKAKEVWSGIPTDVFEYSWDGWQKKTFERQGGKTAGTCDSYWYTPIKQYKLRSLVEVRRFIKFYEKYKDEDKAWRVFKGKKPS